MVLVVHPNVHQILCFYFLSSPAFFECCWWFSFSFLFSKEASGIWMVGWSESEGGIGDGRECGRRLGLRAALCQHRPCQVSGSQWSTSSSCFIFPAFLSCRNGFLNIQWIPSSMFTRSVHIFGFKFQTQPIQSGISMSWSKMKARVSAPCQPSSCYMSETSKSWWQKWKWWWRWWFWWRHDCVPSTGLRVGRSFYQSLPPTAEPFNWEEKDNRNFYNRLQRAAIGSKTEGKMLLPAQIFPSHQSIDWSLVKVLSFLRQC